MGDLYALVFQFDGWIEEEVIVSSDYFELRRRGKEYLGLPVDASDEEVDAEMMDGHLEFHIRSVIMV